MHHPKLEALVHQDGRYAYEAYEFVFAALAHTLRLLGRAEAGRPPLSPPLALPSAQTVLPPRSAEAEGAGNHVGARELLEGIRDLARQEFGLMARTVFAAWGIHATDDFGEIVYRLVDAGLMNKADADDPADFHAAYDLDEALARDYRIEASPDTEER